LPAAKRKSFDFFGKTMEFGNRSGNPSFVEKVDVIGKGKRSQYADD
jgi:hypothetical protein